MLLLIFRLPTFDWKSWLLTLQRESINVPNKPRNIPPDSSVFSCEHWPRPTYKFVHRRLRNFLAPSSIKWKTGGFSTQRRCLTKCSWNLSEISSFSMAWKILCFVPYMCSTWQRPLPVQTDSLPLLQLNSTSDEWDTLTILTTCKFVLLIFLSHNVDVKVSINPWIIIIFFYKDGYED